MYESMGGDSPPLPQNEPKERKRGIDRRPLRILLMMGGRFDNAGAEYAVRLGHMLSEQGHSVLFLGSPDSPAVQKALQSSIQSVKSIQIDYGNPIRLMRAACSFRSILSEFKPNLINTHKSSDHSFASLFSPRIHPPIVRTRSEPRMPGGGLFNRLLYKKATAYVACAGFIRDRHFPRVGVDASAISVIRPGFDVERFRLGAPDGAAARHSLGLEDAAWFGVLARFTVVKAHEVALQAFAEVIQHRVPNAKLFFSGIEYDISIEELRQYAEKLSIADKVHFVCGKVPDIRAALRALDVLLVPSVASESIARIAMEALALGVATVGTGVNSIPEVIGDAGLVVPPNDSRALGEAAVRAFQDMEVRERARELGPERVKQLYSPSEFLAMSEDVFYRSIAMEGKLS